MMVKFVEAQICVYNHYYLLYLLETSPIGATNFNYSGRNHVFIFYIHFIHLPLAISMGSLTTVISI